MEIYPVEFPVLNDREREAVTRYFEIQSYFMASMDFYAKPGNIEIRKLAVSVIARHWQGIDMDAFVPYLAMNYFDRFASRNPESGADVRLVAICCLTIAAKMRTKSFCVDNFRTDKLVVFDLETITRMELHILNGLEWRMLPVTPFCFLDYYYPDFKRLGGFKRRVINKIIVEAHGENNFLECRPSDIAMSSLLAATFYAYTRNVLQMSMNHPEGPYSPCTFGLIDLIGKKNFIDECVAGPSTSEPGSSSSATAPIPGGGGGGGGRRKVAADKTESETKSQKQKRLAKGKAAVVAKSETESDKQRMAVVYEIEEEEMKVVASASEIVPASEAQAKSETESDKQRMAVVSEIEEEEMKVVASASEIVPASEAQAKSETESDKQRMAVVSEIEEEEMKVVASTSEIVPASEAEAKSETESDKQIMAVVSEIEEEEMKVVASTSEIVPASEAEAKSETESDKQRIAVVSEIEEEEMKVVAPISEIVPASEAAPKNLMNFDLMWPTEDPFFVGDGIPPPVPINRYLHGSVVRQERDRKWFQFPSCGRCSIG